MPPRALRVSPAAAAIWLFGFTPIASTAMSAFNVSPPRRTMMPSSASSNAVTPFSRRSAMPCFSISSCRSCAISKSSGGMTCLSISTTETESPARFKFSAASRPMNPPPTTTADFAPFSRIQPRSRSASGTVHSVSTRSESMPGIPGRIGDEPVASRSFP